MTEIEKKEKFKRQADAIARSAHDLHTQITVILQESKDVDFRHPHMIHQLESAAAEISAKTKDFDRYVTNELLAFVSDPTRT